MEVQNDIIIGEALYELLKIFRNIDEESSSEEESE